MGWKMNISSGLVIVAVTAAALSATSANAQRSPAYEAARTAGQVGEQPDGYLGFVTPPTPEISALVKDINIQRKDHYTRGAAQGGTVEKFAQIAGCNLIANTKPGEKYKTPDGRWMTRDASPPVRDSICP